MKTFFKKVWQLCSLQWGKFFSTEAGYIEKQLKKQVVISAELRFAPYFGSAKEAQALIKKVNKYCIHEYMGLYLEPTFYTVENVDAISNGRTSFTILVKKQYWNKLQKMVDKMDNVRIHHYGEYKLINILPSYLSGHWRWTTHNGGGVDECFDCGHRDIDTDGECLKCGVYNEIPSFNSVTSPLKIINTADEKEVKLKDLARMVS